MNTEHFGLLDSDEKVLTAKAAAFRAVALNEKHMFTDTSGSQRSQAKTEVLRTIYSLHAFDQVLNNATSSEEFLSNVRQYLSNSLTVYFERQSLSLSDFISSFDGEARRYKSIAHEVDDWLKRLMKLTREHLRRSAFSVKIPPIRLNLTVDDQQSKGVAGKTDHENGDRLITILFNPAKFTLESYFALPCVLSHELWCHALACCHDEDNFVRESKWNGCSPADSWEEGWMDHLQFQILENEMSAIAPNAAALEALFAQCSLGYLSARHADQSMISRGIGARACYAFHRFLRQYYRGLADDLLIQISLDINVLTCENELKQNFVSWIWESLNPDTADYGKPVESTFALVERRNRLDQVLLANKTKAESLKINIINLLAGGHQN